MVEGGIGVENEGAVEMDICPDCNGEGAEECSECGTSGMGAECGTCNGIGEIEVEKESN